MIDDFFELSACTELSDTSGFSLDKSHEILGAIRDNRDFTVVTLLTHSGSFPERIIVDVRTDGVPPKSASGITFKERIALCIPADPKQLIDVRPLRKNFPILPHQNAVGPGEPVSLCLYFEPSSAVFRTWTPQNFLRRIQWWLDKSATGTLHAADQPLEGLFFLARHELVLPLNAAEAMADKKNRFVVTTQVERVDDRQTFILESVPEHQAPPDRNAAVIDLPLSPIIAGTIERTPQTLGDLSALLESRGADLYGSLRTALFNLVGDSGAAVKTEAPFTIILLHIPVCRQEGGVVERIIHQAFLVPIGPQALGKKAGALIEHEGKYFRDHMNKVPETAWKGQPVESVEVLRENDSATARQQSGLQDKGPNGVLIGLGSLGSAILNLWSRSGWGTWTAMDKDHVKPHNLARHIAHRQHIGVPKAYVAADLHTSVTGDGKVVAVHGDACDLDKPHIFEPLRGAGVVIDISTTLEYPRLASTSDNLPRHVSAFITPSGNASVLLAEDSTRQARLRTLEAQYYRALIQNDYGKDHLEGNLGTYWSGASCRDISVVLPYSRIISHASLLAEQIPSVLNSETAAIKLWHRNPAEGSVTAHRVPVHTEHMRKYGKLDLFYDAGVEEHLRALRKEHLPKETGGVLLGYYDFNVSAVVIVCGLPAPPDSRSGPGFFERGTEGLVEAVNEATRRTGHVVGYVGEWHSHPRGHSANPSNDDIVQLFQLAYGMADDGLPALQLIVGEKDLEILQGQIIS